VSIRDREGLIARIRQLRSIGDPSAVQRTSLQRSPEPSSAGDELRLLEQRVSHLESLLQGFQDSVHRESTRHGERIAELEARIEPAALGRALSEDARNRGL